MNKSDQWVVITLGILLLLHLTIWAFGYWNNKLAAAMAFLNLACAFGVIAYWGVNEMTITQHTIERREIIVLGVELLIIGCAVYGIATGYRNNWLKILQYIFFGIHLLLLILGLVFMLTFKINKLM